MINLSNDAKLKHNVDQKTCAPALLFIENKYFSKFNSDAFCMDPNKLTAVNREAGVNGFCPD